MFYIGVLYILASLSITVNAGHVYPDRYIKVLIGILKSTTFIPTTAYKRQTAVFWL